MNIVRASIVVAALAAGSAVVAQNMVEYSTLPTKPATAANAIGTTSRAVAKKAATLSNAASQGTSTASTSGRKVRRVRTSPLQLRLQQRSSSYRTVNAWNPATMY